MKRGVSSNCLMRLACGRTLLSHCESSPEGNQMNCDLAYCEGEATDPSSRC